MPVAKASKSPEKFSTQTGGQHSEDIADSDSSVSDSEEHKETPDAQFKNAAPGVSIHASPFAWFTKLRNFQLGLAYS